jgi:hypothetical protein
MTEDDLATGYRIAECGVPGGPPKYQVLWGTGRAQQLIAMRDDREQATAVAHGHHAGVHAERAAGLANHGGPGRPVPRQR